MNKRLEREAVRLSRLNRNELYQHLSESVRSDRHIAKKFGPSPVHFRRSHREWRVSTIRAARAIDYETVEVLTKALRGRPSASNGRAWFKNIWDLIGDKICDDWDFCGKTASLSKYRDSGTVIAQLASYILSVLANVSMSVSPGVAVAIASIVVRRARRLCDCPKEED
jgi:hypothetical protein